MEKQYVGHPDGHACEEEGFKVAWIEAFGERRGLDPRLDLFNHSPTGFSWGYYGSGPAQLALAILADVLGDDQEALANYQAFKEEVVARFPGNKGFRIAEGQVRAFLLWYRARKCPRNRADDALTQNGPRPSQREE